MQAQLATKGGATANADGDDDADIGMDGPERSTAVIQAEIDALLAKERLYSIALKDDANDQMVADGLEASEPISRRSVRSSKVPGGPTIR